ncbi:MAG: HAMP domain-containing sensor histidine kinase, partial [Clostridiales bacterium]
NRVKERFIYEQLEISALAKTSNMNKEQNKKEYEDDNIDYDSISVDSSLLVTHLFIKSNESKPKIIIDQLTHSVYSTDTKKEELQELVSQLIKNLDKGCKQKYNIGSSTYLCYIHSMSDTEAMIFFTTGFNCIDGIPQMLLILLILLVVTYFSSKYTAKSITKPIESIQHFSHDIAKRYWESELPIYNTKDFANLTKDLDTMRTALKTADERDRKFLQSTSHDLKTPVMIIKGYAQAIIDKINIDSNEHIAGIIKGESEKLERRIKQLLTLNTIDHTLEYSEKKDDIRLDRLLNSLIQKCKILNSNLEFQLNLLPVEIQGDTDSLVIAFENLFENQVRYASTIINICMSKEEILKIVIENDGSSFSVDQPNSLFDAYKKDEDGNFGLGLSIVHRVIIGHNGTIHAYNTHTGVAFEIQLPLSKNI